MQPNGRALGAGQDNGTDRRLVKAPMFNLADGTQSRIESVLAILNSRWHEKRLIQQRQVTDVRDCFFSCMHQFPTLFSCRSKDWAGGLEKKTKMAIRTNKGRPFSVCLVANMLVKSTPTGQKAKEGQPGRPPRSTRRNRARGAACEKKTRKRAKGNSACDFLGSGVCRTALCLHFGATLGGGWADGIFGNNAQRICRGEKKIEKSGRDKTPSTNKMAQPLLFFSSIGAKDRAFRLHLFFPLLTCTSASTLRRPTATRQKRPTRSAVVFAGKKARFSEIFLFFNRKKCKGKKGSACASRLYLG